MSKKTGKFETCLISLHWPRQLQTCLKWETLTRAEETEEDFGNEGTDSEEMPVIVLSKLPLSQRVTF